MRREWRIWESREFHRKRFEFALQIILMRNNVTNGTSDLAFEKLQLPRAHADGTCWCCVVVAKQTSGTLNRARTKGNPMIRRESADTGSASTNFQCSVACQEQHPTSPSRRTKMGMTSFLLPEPARWKHTTTFKWTTSKSMTQQTINIFHYGGESAVKIPPTKTTKQRCKVFPTRYRRLVVPHNYRV